MMVERLQHAAVAAVPDVAPASAPDAAVTSRPWAMGDPGPRGRFGSFGDWITTVDSTHYCIGSVLGPHPYPWLVREFQRVIGDEARAQCAELLSGAGPDVVVACVGGGSNAARHANGVIVASALMRRVLDGASSAFIGRDVAALRTALDQARL